MCVTNHLTFCPGCRFATKVANTVTHWPDPALFAAGIDNCKRTVIVRWAVVTEDYACTSPSCRFNEHVRRRALAQIQASQDAASNNDGFKFTGVIYPPAVFNPTSLVQDNTGAGRAGAGPRQANDIAGGNGFGGPVPADDPQLAPQANLVPGNLMPGNLVPNHMVPGNQVPGNLVPDHMVPNHMVSGNLVPDYLVPGNPSPDNLMPGNPSPVPWGFPQPPPQNQEAGPSYANPSSGVASKRWTAEEDDYVVAGRTSDPPMSHEELARGLDRTGNAIAARWSTLNRRYHYLSR